MFFISSDHRPHQGVSVTILQWYTNSLVSLVDVKTFNNVTVW